MNLNLKLKVQQKLNAVSHFFKNFLTISTFSEVQILMCRGGCEEVFESSSIFLTYISRTFQGNKNWTLVSGHFQSPDFDLME